MAKSGFVRNYIVIIRVKIETLDPLIQNMNITWANWPMGDFATCHALASRASV